MTWLDPSDDFQQIDGVMCNEKPHSPRHSWTWFARQQIPLPSRIELGEHWAHQVSMDYCKWAFRARKPTGVCSSLGPTFLLLLRLEDGAALLAADKSKGDLRRDAHGKFEPIWKICWSLRIVCMYSKQKALHLSLKEADAWGRMIHVTYCGWGRCGSVI